MLFLSSYKYKIFMLLFVSVFFSSCLTIDSELILNRNGSGTYKIVYTMDKTLKDISSFSPDDNIVPLNLSKEYLDDLLGKIDDIKYTSYNTRETDLNFIVDVVFEFKNIDALNKILPVDNEIIIKKDGSDNVFYQTIISELDSGLSDNSLALFKEIYGNNYFRFIVRLPSDILDVSGGTKIENRAAVYNDSFIDLITTAENKSWSIRW